MPETGLIHDDLNMTSSVTSSDTETQQRCVFGNGEVNPQRVKTQNRKQTPPESNKPTFEPISKQTILCLSKSNLTCVPDSALKNSMIKCLSLDRNQISSIPGSLFSSLPELQFLDLRYNLITSLPPEIGSHRCLRQLLLDANPITELPAEIGNVFTLEILKMTDCPIEFPPEEVLCQGFRFTMQYLRIIVAKRGVSESQELPAEEQLQLTESSTEEQDESADEDGLLRFKELKDELILLEKAEAVASIRRKPRPPPVAKRIASSVKVDISPELYVAGSQCSMRSVDSAEASWREKERKEAFQKARKQARPRARQRKLQEYEEDSKCDLADSWAPSQLDMEMEEDRSARDLQRHIRYRVKKMQERYKNPKGTTAQQVAVTKEDVAEIRKLQARLLEKKTLGRYSEDTFTIYSPDSWPNILFK